jgi:hypothetical protein
LKVREGRRSKKDVDGFFGRPPGEGLRATCPPSHAPHRQGDAASEDEGHPVEGKAKFVGEAF